MNTMRLLTLLAGLSIAAPAVQAAEAPAVADQPAASSSLLDRLFPTAHPVRTHHRRFVSHVRPHDVARPVVRTARADAHEAASAGVVRVRTQPRVERGDMRLAGLDRAGSCDSILCPGYSMLGVGF